MSDDTAEAPAEPFDRALLRSRVAELAAQGVFVGTSSWKYPGWMNQIYTPTRYETRGKFSKAKFEETCVAEYAEIFPVVGGDFSFYQFPTEAFWAKLFASAPGGLRFGFKVPEAVTCAKWPTHARYGARGGMMKENFLNPALIERMFLDPLKQYDLDACFIFGFGTMPKALFPTPGDFFRMLDLLFSGIPLYRSYAVETRNAEYLTPEYFEILKGRGVAHVFNAWTRMPELNRQIAMDGAFTADFTVTRALLRYGRNYETAVKSFEPYDRIKAPYPEAHEASGGRRTSL
jgi:uncharacterized protein YecE (DUF72 family)